jgi:hypothetical protein
MSNFNVSKDPAPISSTVNPVITISDRIKALQEAGRKFPAPPGDFDPTPLVPPLSVLERSPFEFDAAGSAKERLYGYIARSFIDQSRYLPFIDPVHKAENPRPAPEHFERLIEVSRVFNTKLMAFYNMRYGIEVEHVYEQAQLDTQKGITYYSKDLF